MKNSIGNILISFFAHKLTYQVKELYSATLILNFAISLVTIFEPVFIYLLFIDKYSLGQTLQLVMFFYLGVYVLYFFLLPLGAKFAKQYGFEHSIAVSTVFTSLFYLSLYLSSFNINFIFVAIVTYALWKMFYWPAYHSDFAFFSSSGEHGRAISNLLILESVVYIFGPLAGGFILQFANFNVLFILASILMLLSNIPILITKEKFEPAHFSYFGSFARLFRRENFKKMLSLIGFGEELVALTIWPIFIYVMVHNYLGLGIITSASIFVTTIIFLYVGRVTDQGDGRWLLKFGVVVYFFGWLLKIMTRNIFGLFMIDTYSRIAKQTVAIPLIAMTYKKAHDTSIMKTIMFFEMSLVLGKIIAIILVIILLQFFTPGWNAIFIMASLMTLLYLLF